MVDPYYNRKHIPHTSHTLRAIRETGIQVQTYLCKVWRSIEIFGFPSYGLFLHICKLPHVCYSTILVFSPWVPRRPRNTIANLAKSPVSALQAQWRIFAFSPANLTNLQGEYYYTELSVCWRYGPASGGKAILNSDDQIFSNRGAKFQNCNPPQNFWGVNGGLGWGASVTHPRRLQ